jgi:hypothetical protein
VADEEHRATVTRNVAHSAQALPLEFGIAGRQDFVYEEYFGLEMGSHGECQPHIHAGRITLHGRVDESLDLGKRDDLVELRADFRARHSQDRPVEKNVSRPVNSGWNPVPTSSRLATRP